MPELKFAITQQQKSVLTGSIHGPLTQVLATPAVLAEESPTQASFQHQVNPSCGLQSHLSLSEATRRTHRSRHSKSMDNTSLIHSDIFILMVGTYLSLSKCLTTGVMFYLRQLWHTQHFSKWPHVSLVRRHRWERLR